MIDIQTIADLELLRESVDLECKLAAGRDGKGALPEESLTRKLQNLVRDGFLEAHNPGRGAVYCLPGAALPRPEEVFGDGSEHSIPTSAHLPGRSAHLTGDSSGDEHRDGEGRLLADQLDAPVIEWAWHGDRRAVVAFLATTQVERRINS